MMVHVKNPLLISLVVALAACSGASTSAPDAATTNADAGLEDTSRDTVGSDASLGPDAPHGDGDTGNALDASGTPDMEGDLSDARCASLAAAACMATDGCTLAGGCVVDPGGTDTFETLVTGTWEGTAQLTGEEDLPVGETPARLTLFRAGPTSVRGIVSLTDIGLKHTFWGGVAPSGELGIWVGTPQCDQPICDLDFGPAWDVGGMVTLDSVAAIELTTVLTDTSVVDFRVFSSLRFTPSDGFKPVAPIYTRENPIEANWMGDMFAIDANGEELEYFCDFDLLPNARNVFPTFRCAPAESFDDLAALTTPDASSIAWADGVGWFAHGTEPDDLLFVGRVEETGTWSGVVTSRGDVWTAGNPIDPSDVPPEHVRGVFEFYGFPFG